MNDEAKLVIRVLSQGEGDVAHVAEQLEKELGEDAQVEVATEQPSQLAGRAVDPALMLQVISVTAGVVQAGVALTQVLNRFKNQAPQVSFIVENVDTGDKIRILQADSEKGVAKKVGKVVPKRGLFRRRLRRRQPGGSSRNR